MSDKGKRLVVVSNRVPALDAAISEETRRQMPVGGLVSALRAALEEQESIWLGWSGTTAENVGPSNLRISRIGRTQLATFDLTRAEVSLFYNVFSNRTLWPLLHNFPAKATIRHDAYRAYRRVNYRYAEALFPLLEEDDLVWVQDYHLASLGHYLRRFGWEGKIGYFLHTPFPPLEAVSIMPWADEFLESLFAYDLVGLQTRRYVSSLFDTLSTELGGHLIGDVFTWKGQSMPVRAYPVGIDPEAFSDMAKRSDHKGPGRFVSRMPQGHRMILGVDRLDYTKGIVLRLRTFEHLLEHYPSLRRNVSMLQISSPSRSRVPEYIEEREQVDQIVGRVNGRFGEAGWVPIHYHYRTYAQTELAAFYHEANVCLVTPLRDGMNLVAKEFVASQGENPGVLVLSRFCGAAETMREALIVNPYDYEATAEAVSRALRMPRSERVRRWHSLNESVRAYTARDWSNDFLSDLARV